MNTAAAFTVYYNINVKLEKYEISYFDNRASRLRKSRFRRPWLIVKRLVVGMWRANCYIVSSASSKQGLIIDPGDESSDILAAVKSSGVDIKLLVATHGHIDHIGAIGVLKRTLGASVAIHESDSTALQGDGRFFWGQHFGPPMNAPIVEGRRFNQC
jgi:glyoxylase-like metal-dependent hydrolase (beta-lactamase superfamily II)